MLKQAPTCRRECALRDLLAVPPAPCITHRLVLEWTRHGLLVCRGTVASAYPGMSTPFCTVDEGRDDAVQLVHIRTSREKGPLLLGCTAAAAGLPECAAQNMCS